MWKLEIIWITLLSLKDFRLLVFVSWTDTEICLICWHGHKEIFIGAVLAAAVQPSQASRKSDLKTWSGGLLQGLLSAYLVCFNIITTNFQIFHKSFYGFFESIKEITKLWSNI